MRAARRGDVQIDVTFEIDTDGIVHVSAKDLESGREASTTITLSSGMNETEIVAATKRHSAVGIAIDKDGIVPAPAKGSR